MSSISIEYDNERFHIPSNFSDRQFFNIYQDRLNQLRPSIECQLTDKNLCENLNHTVSGVKCTIIGVVYKNLSTRQVILDSYKDIGYDSQAPEVLEQSEQDTVFLEDNTGRIELVGVPVNQFVTGLVIGVEGVPEAAKFNVTGSIYYPMHTPPPEVDVPVGHRVAFISDLCINGESEDLKSKHKALIKALQGVDLAVYMGNNFHEVAQPDPDEMISFNERIDRTESMPVSKLESFLKGTRLKNIIVMPGQNDPCTIALPQQPYHPVLLSKKSFILSTNPSKFMADGLTFLCDAGESPLDITKTTSFTFHEAQVELLKWKHIAPTAPDQLPCVPVIEKDVLVMETIPHVFACGLANEFEVTEYDGVIVISVPSFQNSGSIVEFNTKTREVKEIKL